LDFVWLRWKVIVNLNVERRAGNGLELADLPRLDKFFVKAPPARSEALRAVVLVQRWGKCQTQHPGQEVRQFSHASPKAMDKDHAELRLARLRRTSCRRRGVEATNSDQ
jgi:hypothetical protein